MLKPEVLLKSVSGSKNVAFRIASAQMGGIRAFGDFKYGRINLACAARTPTSLSTWEHLAQLALNLRDANQAWSFSKSDRSAAYINLPMSPLRALACALALRYPSGKRWYGFPPLTFLSGEAAAVIHYNFFSREVAILANRFADYRIRITLTIPNSRCRNRCLFPIFKVFRHFDGPSGSR